MPNHTVQLKILRPEIEPYLPKYQTAGAAAVDLHACISEPVELHRGSQPVMIPTGFAIHISDPGYVAIIAPRSGLGTKQGLVFANTIGVIDSDYQGELQLSAWNRNTDLYTFAEPIVVRPFDRIGQMLLLPVVRMNFEVVDEFVASERGTNGWGSTGNA